MRFLFQATLIAGAMAYNYGHHRPLGVRDYDNRVYFAVELDGSKTPQEFAKSRSNNNNDGWTFEQQLGSLENHYLFSVDRKSESAELVEGIRDRPTDQIAYHESLNLYKRDEKDLYKRELELDGVASLQVLEPKRLYKRAPPPVHPVDSSMIPMEEAIRDLHLNDPEFRKQWHLVNPTEPGNDLNITGVWRQGITGKNALAVAVVDDGLAMDHEDLKANYYAPGSYDFNDVGPDPRPRLDDDRHGTRCAGEIAAVRNDVCGVGVAYDGKVAGIRILSARISEADEALALNYAMDKNGIYSCSWGPPDNGLAIAEPGMVVRKAILNGIENGRDKKGSIFVFASGNGGVYGDNCNFDGYTNSIYSITVAAIDHKGFHPEYSEACSANMVVTYSSGSNDHIHTTDFHDGCTDHHGGTSAAAPIAAGVFSLVLEVRPELSWRDMQYLAMDTAVKVNEYEPGWQKTFAGKEYHHKYGYGKIDAYRIVERAKEWPLVKPQAWHFHDRQVVNQDVVYSEDDDDDKCAISTVEVTKEALAASNFDRVEHVNVYMNIDHEFRGAISARLVSPEGIVSNVLEPRYQDDSNEGLVGWTVMSVAHWGEPGHGNWTLKICNNKKKNTRGKFKDWRLKLWGESKNADKAMLYPIPKDADPDPDHRPSSAPSYTPTEPALKKPTKHVSSAHHAHTSKSLAAATKTSSVPSHAAEPSKSSTAAASTATSSSVPWSMIPTFGGLSSHTLAWVYGSILLILGFIGCITMYICVSRRKNERAQGYKRNPAMSSMEFDLIPARGEDSDSDDNDEESRFYKDTPSQGLSRSSGKDASRDGGGDDDDDDVGVYSPRDSEDKEDRGLTAGRIARTLYDTGSSGTANERGHDDEANDNDQEQLLNKE